MCMRMKVKDFVKARLKDGVHRQNYEGFVKKFWEEAQYRVSVECWLYVVTSLSSGIVRHISAWIQSIA